VAAPARTLTIAGSDSGGGAGIQADLKTFTAHGVHGMSAITAVTVQNSVGVQGFYELEPRAVFEQIESVVTDIGVDAAKTGMLASAAIIAAVADACERFAIPNLVVDPVAVSKHGDPLLHPDAVEALRSRLLPLATVVTPNAGEAELLSGVPVRERAGLEAAARALHDLGPRWVLVKGGHVPGPDATDLLWDGRQAIWLEARRLDTPHTHGTGCTLSSAITANLAGGLDVVSAVRAAKQYLTGAIAGSYPLGKGIGPTDPVWRLRAAGVLRPGGPSHPTPSSWPYAPNPYEG
jgi:hydroxymethylpyrimidine/phosphomethylpyrimidine kinase